MMSNNKILTVSYGTFSCTLEGFEDSFDTMKAIAEYFRDLAADDRYFGAEPPQPDVEMLARIAEREVERRVEASMSDTGVHLRAADTAVAALAAVDAAAAVEVPERAETDDSKLGADTDVATPDSDEDRTDSDSEDGAFDDVANADEPEGDEDLTALIRATQDDAPSAEDDTAQAPVTTAEATQRIEPASDEEMVMHASQSYSATGLMASAPDTDAADDDEHTVAEDIDMPATEAEPNSIADKLQRIRAVVAKNQSEAVPYSEDQHAEEFLDLVEDEAADDLTADTSTIVADDAEESVIDDTTAAVSALAQQWRMEEDDTTENTGSIFEDDANENVLEASHFADDASDDAIASETFEDDDLAEELARISDEFADDEATADPASEEGVAEQADDVRDAENADFAEDDLGLDTDAFDALLDEDTVDEDKSTSAEEPDEDKGASEDAPYVLGEPIDDADAADTASQAASSQPIRVIKVKRAEIQAALEEGRLEEVSDLTETADDETLSSSDEEELMRELASVEAELETVETDQFDVEEQIAEITALDDDDQDEFNNLDEDDEAADASAARLLEEAAGAEEDALDRLMAEADSQMDEPEGTSRRSAFSHLRAAVAATKADGKLSQAAKGPVDDDYRTDLAATVKPRRPVVNGETRKERPANERPAPLKLVAEQRVDASQSNADPVLPRRVSAASETELDDAGNFPEYAEARGASDLPELLEAAAAYLSFVEGREQFSRPQLMTKVRQLDLDGFTREDGLRHFGQLLRAGKIEKIKGGRFTVSDEIGFRPDDDQRAAS